MTLWYETAGPEPVPAVEVAALGAQLLRERDKALAEAAAAGVQLDAAKREIAGLLKDIHELRRHKFGQVSADILRQADRDRANAVRRETEIRALWLVNEDLLRELAVLRALVGEPVTT